MKSKIIYITDHEEDRESKIDLLQRENLEILTAATEEEASQIVEENSDIQLIIIGVIEAYKPEIMNTPPCDAIPKIVGRFVEDPTLPTRYKNAEGLDIDTGIWLSELPEAIRQKVP